MATPRNDVTDNATVDSPQTDGARVHFAQSRDIEEQAGLLTGWNQTYDQLSSGNFQGSLLEARISGVHLFCETTQSSLYQRGQLPPNLRAVGLPLSMTGPASFCGTECNGNQLHIFSGSAGFEFHSPTGLVMAVVAIDNNRLASALFGEDQDRVEKTLVRPHLRILESEKSAWLRNTLAETFTRLKLTSDWENQEQQLRLMSDELVETIATAVSDTALEGDGDLPAARRWQIVREVRSLIEDEPDSKISIEDLCRRFDVSRRTLQYCFLDVLGVAPAAFIRTVRLNGAHRDMATAKSVTDAALNWGFWHFGRFAQDYRELFGERPSETFRRRQGTLRL